MLIDAEWIEEGNLEGVIPQYFCDKVWGTFQMQIESQQPASDKLVGWHWYVWKFPWVILDVGGEGY